MQFTCSPTYQRLLKDKPWTKGTSECQAPHSQSGNATLVSDLLKVLFGGDSSNVLFQPFLFVPAVKYSCPKMQVHFYCHIIGYPGLPGLWRLLAIRQLRPSWLGQGPIAQLQSPLASSGRVCCYGRCHCQRSCLLHPCYPTKT